MNSFIADLSSAGSLGVALVAGGACLARGSSPKEAIEFAGVTTVGMLAGDIVLTKAGFDTKIESFLPNNGYFDPLDFVSGAVTVGALLYYMDYRGSELNTLTLIAGLSSGVGRKVGGMLMQYMPGAASGNK